MSILSSYGPQNPQRRSDCIASTFNRQLDDILRIEIVRIRSEGSAGGMLDSLIHR